MHAKEATHTRAHTQTHIAQVEEERERPKQRASEEVFENKTPLDARYTAERKGQALVKLLVLFLGALHYCCTAGCRTALVIHTWAVGRAQRVSNVLRNVNVLVDTFQEAAVIYKCCGEKKISQWRTP